MSFYSNDDYKEVNRLFYEWKDFKFLKTRAKVFDSCINVIINPTIEKNQVATVIIPTLIAQLDGVIRDFYVSHVCKIKKEKINFQKFLSDSKFWDKLPRKIIFPLLSSILHIFEKSNTIDSKIENEEIIKYNLYRNKILHGESIEPFYGTSDNLIRLICYLNSAFTCINQIQQYFISDNNS